MGVVSLVIGRVHRKNKNLFPSPTAHQTGFPRFYIVLPACDV
jgi:hypothetical protein